MKEKSIKAMNTVGLVGKIISVLAIALGAVGTFGIIVGIIVTLVFPKNFVDVKVNTEFETVVDLSGFGKGVEHALSEADLQKQLLEGATFNGNGLAKVLVKFEGAKIIVNGDTQITQVNMKTIRGYLCIGLISLASIIVISVFVLRLCNAFRICSTPFCNMVITRMNQLAWALIPWAVVVAVAQMLANNFATGNVNFSMNINLSYIIVVVLLFGLVQIFKYGADLQQEADETL